MWTAQLDVFRGIRQKGIKVYYIFKYDFLIKILNVTLRKKIYKQKYLDIYYFVLYAKLLINMNYINFFL